MSEEALISIITPVLNAEDYIVETAKSLLKQSWDNWEWLVVDNGCSDRSMKLLDDFVDSRIHRLSEPQKGVGKARNKGLQIMTGKYFCFIDADDRFPPDSLKCRIEKFQTDQQIDFVDGVVKFFDQPSQSYTKSWNPQTEGNPTKKLLNMDESCFFGNTWMIKNDPSVAYRFNEEMSHAEDLLFYLSICRNKNLAFVEKPVLHYRVGHNSAMSDLYGLQRGYSQLVSASIKLGYSKDETSLIRSKAKSIMIKSWLKSGNISMAVSTALKKFG